MKLSSPAFQEGQAIPAKYTCQGENVSPHLVITAVPENAVSLALIMNDPDAPMGTWTHWVVLNLDPKQANIPENFKETEKVLFGLNSFGETKWGGPCPPSGTHRYFFKLFALDIQHNSAKTMTAEDAVKVMEGHILSTATLMGTYQKQ